MSTTRYSEGEHDGFVFELHRLPSPSARHAGAWQCRIVIPKANLVGKVAGGDLTLVPAFRWRGYDAIHAGLDVVLTTALYTDSLDATLALANMVGVLRELGVEP